MTETLANELALLAAATPMPSEDYWKFMAICARVRRLELFCDEIFQEACAEAAMVESGRNVVRVDFLTKR